MLSQRDSFSTWADDFLRLKNAARITDRQKENYRHTVDVWKSELQGYEIRQVRADDVGRVLVGLQEAGFAARTISFYRSAIHQIMQRAVGRIISSNPVDLVRGIRPNGAAPSPMKSRAGYGTLPTGDRLLPSL